MDDVKKLLLSDAIESYLRAEIKLSRLKIVIAVLSTVCVIEAIILILR